MMRILYLATNLPVPAISGQAIRTLSLVRALAALGHELAFVAPAPTKIPANLDPLQSCCRGLDLLPGGNALINLSEGGGYARRLACLLRGRSYACERFRSAPLRAKIAQHLADHRFDLIWCDNMFALINVPPTAVPICLNSHNVEHLILRRFAQVDRNPARRGYARWEAGLLRHAERRASRLATLQLACSELDREALQRLCPGAPVFLAPNVVESARGPAPPESERPAGPPVLLFQGAMDWYPNRDAMEFFAAHILPRIRACFPAVKFVVAGRNPPPALLRRWQRDASIEFTGTVPDMAPWLDRASLVVVPLRIGGGTRIKILEAGAAGKAVVSTRVGAEGLELRHGREILLADEPAAFAQCVVELLQNSSLRREIAAAARQTVLRLYSPETLQGKLAAALAMFAQTPAAGGQSPVVQACP